MYINISIKKTSKICLVVVNEFWILLLGVKNEKLGIRPEENMPEEKRQNLAETDTGILLQSIGMARRNLRR